MKRDKTASAIYLTLLLAAALATSAAPAQDEAPEPATGDGATAPSRARRPRISSPGARRKW